jgi:xanthine dehydrogenase YagR molybdenum-binding subunit
MFALESAIDELAVALRVDPIELRLKNYAERNPLKNKPFSSKGLKQCYLEGAERFGWKRRSPEAQSMKEGRDLIGWGMASAIMTTFRFPANCRVTLERAGTVLIEAGTQEIGTGVRTVIPQIAAEVLGIPADLIHLRLGDTSLPETGGTFGSSTTIGVGSAVYDGASKLKRSVLDLNGGIMPVSQREISEFLSQRGLDRVSADGSWSPGPNANGLGEVPDWSMDTFGAVFTEVRIDQELPVPRVTRCLGIYSAGRIVNPKTARSQMIGGMVWGIGQALLEHSAMDHSLGRYLSKNLSGYLVPVNADVPALEAYFVDEVDQQASAFGGKGIGELGAVGVAAAIVNAIYHATGKRIRQVPVLPEMLL